MSETKRRFRLYLGRVLREVQANKQVKDTIAAELEDHFYTAMEEEQAEGKDEDEACAQTLCRMGNPKTVGKYYNQVYRVDLFWWERLAFFLPWVELAVYFTAAAAFYEHSRQWQYSVRYAYIGPFVCLPLLVMGIVMGRRQVKRNAKWLAYLFGGLSLPLLWLLWNFLQNVGTYLNELEFGERCLEISNLLAQYGLPVLCWIAGFGITAGACYLRETKSEKWMHRLAAAALVVALVIGCVSLQSGKGSDADLQVMLQALRYDCEGAWQDSPETMDTSLVNQLLYTMEEDVCGAIPYIEPSLWRYCMGLREFYLDYDGFRSDSRGWQTIQIALADIDGYIDLTTLPDASDETRYEIYCGALDDLAALLANFQPCSFLGYVWYAPWQWNDFYDAVGQLEEAFYTGLPAALNNG